MCVKSGLGFYSDSKWRHGLIMVLYVVHVRVRLWSMCCMCVRFLTGQVDKRTLEKYEREAKEKNRETWYLSWALDTNQEERDKVTNILELIKVLLIYPL